MESRKMVLMDRFSGQQWTCRENRLMDMGWGGEEGEGRMNGERTWKPIH